MKKIYIILTIFLSFFMIDNVKAASGKITISPANKTILVGNNITVTVTTTSSTSLGGATYTVNYDSNMLSLVSTNSPSGGARTVAYFDKAGHTTMSYTYTFKAKASGNTTISIIGAEAGDDSGNSLSLSTGTASIKIMTQKELEATYSSNNNLSNLSVSDYNLEPAFDKNVLEYKVTLKPETEVIHIDAAREDSTATVNGIGDIQVSEGTNTIKIDVVAQNGNIKSYIINATVEEYDPINVSLDGVDYTVVRSKKVQTFSNNLFTETTIQIGENDVPAYYNENTKTTLVALKDSNGNIEYFVYDNNNYRRFDEIKFGSIDLMLVEAKDIPKHYNKTTITIGDKEYTAYKYNDTSRFALVYGTNIDNGNTGYYIYDNLESSLQRYDDELIKNLDDENSKLMKIVYILGATSIGLLVLLIASFAVKISSKEKRSDMATLDDKVEKDLDSTKVAIDIQSQIEDKDDTFVLKENNDIEEQVIEEKKENKKNKKKTKKK